MSCFSCPSTDLITLVFYCVNLAKGVLKAEVTVKNREDGGRGEGWGQKNRSPHVGDLRPRS